MRSQRSRREASLAVDETVILLHRPLPLVYISIRMARGCQQDDSRSPTATGFVHGLPVFSPSASPDLVNRLEDMDQRLAALPEPLDTKNTFWFFKSSRR